MILFNWKYQRFEALSPSALYAILTLRNQVFIVEQQCIYQDADGRDAAALHISGWQGDDLVAYCRLLPPGVAYESASIGRVVVAEGARGHGLARVLMHQAIAHIAQEYKTHEITISAQQYLQRFYETLRFKAQGAAYLEDGIPHIKMHYSG